jgi:hypothetical protein
MSVGKRKAKALVDRVFKAKDPKLSFFCPLCRSQRYFVYSSTLRPKHYGQLFLSYIVIMYLLYPLMKERVFLLIFFLWGFMEFARKLIHRKEIPCPHCGFDMSWYQRDVTVAKKLVVDFWKDHPRVKAMEPSKASQQTPDTAPPPS